MHNPSVLILDEPTNGLDPSGIREIWKYIRKLALEDNVSVIVSSHFLSEIDLMCDRIGVIKNGEIIAIKDLNETDTSDTQIVNLHVQPKEQAIELLNHHSDIQIVDSSEDIQVKMDKSAIPKLIATLVSKNIKVYGVNAVESTLEDQFLEMIGDNIIE